MTSKQNIINLIYSLLFGLVIMVIIIGVPLSADRNISIHEVADSYSERWQLEDGKKVTIDDLNIGDYGGTITVKKVLTYGVTDKDELCFKSENTNIKVYIDQKQVYGYESKPNLTGMGYGIAFHEVGISKSDAGKTVRIEYEQVYEGQKKGRIYDMYLCSASYFIQMNIRKKLVSSMLSILNIFLGVTFLVAYLGAFNKAVFPFNILAVGTSALLTGIWLLIDTNILQMTTGFTYVCRDIRLILPFMLAYPSICFFNSQTEKKRPAYNHLGFFISIIPAFGIVFLRYVMEIDMLDSFMKFFAVCVIAGISVLIVMAIENSIYCDRTGKKNRLRYLYIGGIIFVVCGIPDLLQYILLKRNTDDIGLFLRIGSVVYASITLIEFLRWWMKDNEEITRDRFINRTLQYALSSDSPDANIRSILAFLGKELDARRLFIFEDQKNGKFRGTYEWYRDGEESFGIEMMYLSSEEIAGRIYDEFNKNDHRLIVKDPEAFKNSIPGFYNILKANKVDNMIIGPLEVSGNLFGVCGVVGVPSRNLESVAEIINLISYFLSQLILQRENQSRALNYTYRDALSGCGNFASFKKFIECDLDMASAFGCVRCDLCKLDETNVTKGYEVGDQMVVVTAKLLMEIYGESKVFRVGGTQFIAFDDEAEERFFENSTERLKKMIDENAIDAKLSSVYCLYGTKDINIVLGRLDDLMREKTQEE